MRCPLCQNPFQITGSVDSLPSNFIVKQWLDHKEQISKKQSSVITSQDSDIVCENCEEKPAIFFCENCSGIHYCKECDSSVHSTKALRNHSRITVEEKKKRPVYSKCVSHKEDNKFFCLECKMVICSHCLVEMHPHKAITISKYADLTRSELLKSLENHFTMKIKNFTNDITKKENEIVLLENRKKKMLEELEKIISDIEERKREKEKAFELSQKTESNFNFLSQFIQEVSIMEFVNADFMKSLIEQLHQQFQYVPEPVAKPDENKPIPITKLPEPQQVAQVIFKPEKRVAKKRNPPNYFIIEPDGRVYCLLCGVRMTMTDKPHHEVGKKHVKNLPLSS